MFPVGRVASVGAEYHAPMNDCLEQVGINGERPKLILELAVSVGFGKRSIVNEVVHEPLHEGKLAHEYLGLVVHCSHAERPTSPARRGGRAPAGGVSVWKRKLAIASLMT